MPGGKQIEDAAAHRVFAGLAHGRGAGIAVAVPASSTTRSIGSTLPGATDSACAASPGRAAARAARSALTVVSTTSGLSRASTFATAATAWSCAAPARRHAATRGHRAGNPRPGIRSRSISGAKNSSAARQRRHPRPVAADHQQADGRRISACRDRAREIGDHQPFGAVGDVATGQRLAGLQQFGRRFRHQRLMPRDRWKRTIALEQIGRWHVGGSSQLAGHPGVEIVVGHVEQPFIVHRVRRSERSAISASANRPRMQVHFPDAAMPGAEQQPLAAARSALRSIVSIPVICYVPQTPKARTGRARVYRHDPQSAKPVFEQRIAFDAEPCQRLVSAAVILALAMRPTSAQSALSRRSPRFRGVGPKLDKLYRRLLGRDDDPAARRSAVPSADRRDRPPRAAEIARGRARHGRDVKVTVDRHRPAAARPRPRAASDLCQRRHRRPGADLFPRAPGLSGEAAAGRREALRLRHRRSSTTACCRWCIPTASSTRQGLAALPMIEPVYPLTEGLALGMLRRAIDAALLEAAGAAGMAGPGRSVAQRLSRRSPTRCNRCIGRQNCTTSLPESPSLDAARL